MIENICNLFFTRIYLVFIDPFKKKTSTTRKISYFLISSKIKIIS